LTGTGAAPTKPAMLTPELVKTALAGVIDPIFDKPMLELGTLEVGLVEGGTVALNVRLPTRSERLERRLLDRVESALAPLGGAQVKLSFQHEVPTREVMGDDPVPGVKNVILVMSGKGGVGKSTTAVNLTLALGALGLRVGLLDADVYGPSIPTMMGVSGSPVSRDGQKIAPLERFGVKMMSIGFLLEDDKQAVVWRGPMLHGALSQFLRDVDWGPLDFLVLDLPPGTGDVALTMAQKLKVTGVVMVTTPQEVALADVYKAVSMCQKLSMPILGVVENMSWFIDSAGVKHTLFGKGGGQKIADFAQAPLLAQIPIETAVQEGGDAGLPVVKGRPESTAGRAFLELADAVAAATARLHFDRAGGKLPSGKGPTRLKIVR
jgi:ATP-binding protein involved in chromosome partitioning